MKVKFISKADYEELIDFAKSILEVIDKGRIDLAKEALISFRNNIEEKIDELS